MTQPNIILVLSDEHRGQAMAHAGDPNVRTPALDRLAAEGVSFGRAYANCPICTPSRGTIFSGRHAHAGPVSGFFDVYKATAPSLATELRAAGYHTAYFGKWHCGVVRDQLPASIRAAPPEKVRGTRHRTPERHRAGFQDWCAFESLNRHFEVSVYRNEADEPEWLEGYETDALTDEVLRYLETYDRNQPLFLVLSVTPPHFPLVAPERWLRHGAALQVRPNFVDHPAPPSAGNIPGGFLFRDDPPWSVSMRHALAQYYAMIEDLDWNIGRLCDALQGDPRFAGQNTMFCYTSDHGEFLGSHGLCERKEHPHEESVRVPLVIHAPGRVVQQGWRAEGLIGLVDLMPTLMGLVGLPAPAWGQGQDCSAAVAQGDGSLPRVQLLEMHNNPRWNLDYMDWRGLVTHELKYAYYETGHELLFDLVHDPYEMHNLAQARPDLCAELRGQLLDLLRATREPFFDVVIEHGVPCSTSRNVSGTNYQITGVPVDPGGR